MRRPIKISRKHIPSYLPINFTAIVYLLLDRWSVPGWVWGVAATLLALLWIGAISSMWNEDDRELKTEAFKP